MTKSNSCFQKLLDRFRGFEIMSSPFEYTTNLKIDRLHEQKLYLFRVQTLGSTSRPEIVVKMWCALVPFVHVFPLISQFSYYDDFLRIRRWVTWREKAANGKCIS